MHQLAKVKPGRLGTGPNGKPAIQWWRHGCAALGEPSIVTIVKEYESEQDQLLAVVDHEQGDSH